MKRHAFSLCAFILLASAIVACSGSTEFPQVDVRTLEATYSPPWPSPSSMVRPIPPTFTLSPRATSTASDPPIPAATRTPASPPHPLIAFVSNSEDREGVYEVYTLDSRSLGANWICCTGYVQFGGSNAGDPAWSFDGQLLALVSDKTGIDQIFLFNDMGIGSPGMGFVFLSDGTANDREPAWSPDSSQIVFVSDRSGSDDLFIMNADGSGVHSLTQGPASDGSPAWSPDGRWIAFASTRSGGSDLYMVSLDGGEPLRLADHPALDGAPAWSPDGRKIAFMSQREGGNWEIYVLDVESGEVRRLTDHPAADQYPSWSGEQIAFMSARDGNFEIYTMNVDGSVQTRLTSSEGLDGYPVWSSPLGAPALASPTTFTGPTSGERIVFTSNRDGAGDALWVMAADGNQQTRLDNAPNLDPQGVQQPYGDWQPQWSPDGKQIVFMSNREGGEFFSENLWLINADGSGLRMLPASGESPAWAPDNRRIAYLYVGVHEIYTIAVVLADGTDSYTLFENEDVRDPSGAQTPMLWYLYGGLDWSPDGRRIAFVAEGLWTARDDGSDARRIVLDGVSPAWSPDGRKIAFKRGCGIWVVTVDGTGEQQVFEEPGCDVDAGSAPLGLCRPTWAPDGGRLAFHSEMDGDAEIYTIHLDGSGLTQLTDNDTSDVCPDWSWR